MANQYGGRKATIEEMQAVTIDDLRREAKVAEDNMNYFVDVLTANYKKNPDPDICRLLVIAGVDVWSIDKERGVETVYTTQPQLNERQH